METNLTIKKIIEILDNYLKNENLKRFPKNINDIMKYFIGSGKHLRPLLFISGSGTNLIDLKKYDNDNREILLNTASNIEMLHCLSLIMDDLPEMDNDSMRRNMPTFHVKYGKKFTDIFIYYMFNKLINISILDIYDKNGKNTKNEKKYANSENLSFTLFIKNFIDDNMNNLIDGQYLDLKYPKISLDNSNKKLFYLEKHIICDILKSLSLSEKTNETPDYIHNLELSQYIDLTLKKTSALFNLSLILGIIYQLWFYDIDIYKYVENTISYISQIANLLGFLLQISDDLSDCESDFEKGKPNICKILNKENVEKLLENGCKFIINEKNEINKKMHLIHSKMNINFEIIEYILNMIIKNANIGCNANNACNANYECIPINTA